MRPTLRRPPRWWALGPALASAIVIALLLGSRWGAILASQPAYLVTLLVGGTVAVALSGWALVGTGVEPRRPRGKRWVVVRRGAGIIATLGALVVLVWLRPLPATAVAVAAMASSDAVTVTDSSSSIALAPARAATRTALIFFPGALVDPRAYVPLLRPLAGAGFTVEIVKPPFGIAFLSAGAPNGIIAAHRRIRRWVVGGHSLGGVVASSYAGAGHPGVDGLLLWASYPSGNVASMRSVSVTSVSASNDGLATPAKIGAMKDRLPPGTRFVVVEGAVHSDFGDYGVQRGDGEPTVDRAQAQHQIEAASLALLREVDAAPSPSPVAAKRVGAGS